MISSNSFIKNILEKTTVKIPFAIMEWNDLNEQNWLVKAAFDNREDAESHMANLVENGGCYMISENQVEPLCEFCYLQSNAQKI